MWVVLMVLIVWYFYGFWKASLAFLKYFSRAAPSSTESAFSTSLSIIVSNGKIIVFTRNHSLRSFNPYHWHHTFSKDNFELLCHHPCPVLYIIVISFINLSVNSSTKRWRPVYHIFLSRKCCSTQTCAIKKSFLMNQ